MGYKKIIRLLIVVIFTHVSLAQKETKNSMEKSYTFVFFSDTHGKHREIKVPKGDFLIFCGDMCPRGQLEDVESFAYWLKSLPHKNKIVIAGNHDRPFENEQKQQAEHLLKLAGAIYLNDSGVEIENIKFWGSPIQPEFNNWYFGRKRGLEIKKHWDKIPLNTNILITHGPPFGILDKNLQDESVGCKELFKRVNKVKPKLHAFGHIHEAYGKLKKNNITFINASSLNARYQYTNPPIVIKQNF